MKSITDQLRVNLQVKTNKEQHEELNPSTLQCTDALGFSVSFDLKTL